MPQDPLAWATIALGVVFVLHRLLGSQGDTDGGSIFGDDDGDGGGD